MSEDCPGVDPDWVVSMGVPTLPAHVRDAAAASHATLGEKLSVLRRVQLEFPRHPGPAAADRWIDSGELGPAAP